MKVVLPPCHSFDFEGRCIICGLVGENEGTQTGSRLQALGNNEEIPVMVVNVQVCNEYRLQRADFCEYNCSF